MRLHVLSLSFAVAAALVTGTASAAVINAGDTVAMTAAETFSSDQLFGATGPELFIDRYTFVPAIADAAFGFSAATESAAGATGIRNLRLIWRDMTTGQRVGSVRITNRFGVFINGATNFLDMVADHNYRLLVRGVTMRNGGSYGIDLQYTPDLSSTKAPVSSVPLPTAAMLLLSGLLGMGALARLRMRKPVA